VVCCLYQQEFAIRVADPVERGKRCQRDDDSVRGIGGFRRQRERRSFSCGVLKIFDDGEWNVRHYVTFRFCFLHDFETIALLRPRVRRKNPPHHPFHSPSTSRLRIVPALHRFPSIARSPCHFLALPHCARPLSTQPLDTINRTLTKQRPRPTAPKLASTTKPQATHHPLHPLSAYGLQASSILLHAVLAPFPFHL
jgi:hypothetical protein